MKDRQLAVITIVLETADFLTSGDIEGFVQDYLKLGIEAAKKEHEDLVEGTADEGIPVIEDRVISLHAETPERVEMELSEKALRLLGEDQ
jgi:hypothetical protein